MAAPETTAILGVDIGGTRIRVGIVTPDGQILARTSELIPPEGEPEPLRELVTREATDVVNEAGIRPVRAGVAMPGVWDPDTTIMKKAVNLPRLEGTNLTDLFSAALHLPVRLEADVNAAVWGQWRRMKPQPQRLVYISLGTGVGGSVILDGQIVRHTRGGAGHFGFLIVDTSPAAPAGRNGVPGCLSALAAGPALHLAATGQTDNEAIGEEPYSDEVIDRAARGLAVACMNLVHMYNPNVIALGGGVVDNHPEIVEHARDAFSSYSSPLIAPDLQIRRAPLTTHEAGVIGSALLASSES